tara:strand:+ start:62 stop:922 length:861 start_codon:yes stop_codon:yes gene_type:complete
MNYKNKILGFYELIRADKPIGTLLLLWPTLSAFVVLTNGNPNLFLISLFVLGTFLMRSAGCVINDYFDMEFDGSVDRTKNRPLVTGIIQPYEALILFLFLISISCSLLIWMNFLAVKVAVFGLALATFYPLTKRFFAIPQLFLGLAFSWGILMVSAAELNEINGSSLFLFASCFFWILAYDTAYAMSDKEDDVKVGLHSSAITFGKKVVYFFILFHLISLSIWSWLGYELNLHPLFYLSSVSWLALIFYQYLLIRNYDRDNCLLAFKNNNWVGFSLLVGSMLGTSL